MPRALPGSVSELPLADDGISNRSPESAPGSTQAGRFGHSPVDDQRLPMLAQNDIRRLDVSMNHASRVGIVNGIADVNESAEQFAVPEVARARVAGRVRRGVEAVNGFLEAVATDEPHGVIRAAVAVCAKSVDRDDAGMLQAASDLGLDEEARSAGGVVGAVVENLLESNFAVELGVKRDEDGAQSAPGMRPEDAEPLPIGGG